MTEKIDVAVIGAGVVGLAVAAELSKTRRVAILERHGSYGLETSSHNSGVVHAGIYYPPDWLKTTLCIEGNRLLYRWAGEHGVRARRTGKLIIAVDESERPALEALYRAAQANGVPELEFLPSAGQVGELEPSVTAVAAVYSGSSGVIDQMELMRSFARAARADGAMIAYKHEVASVRREGGGFAISAVDPAGETVEVRASAVVNSGGLAADRVAGTLGYPLEGGGGTPRLKHTINKGRYFDIVNAEKAAVVSHLIYPLPHGDRTGLGVHVTLDIDGGVHLGPDTEWIGDGASLDYRSDDSRRGAFIESARRYLPWLEEDDVLPGQVGYRPKLVREGEGPGDFLIWRDRGYVHLGGIESPGMTASMAIARRVASALGGQAGVSQDDERPS